MVFYDGERLNVQIAKGKADAVLAIAERYPNDSDYIASVGIYSLPATKNVARALHEAGYVFDKSADIFLKGIKADSERNAYKRLGIPDDLFPFQKEGVRRMLGMSTNVLLADEMGLGKTVQGAVYLKLKEDALPALVICPASLKQNWANEIKKWTGVDSCILSGRNPQFYSDEFLKKYPVFIINYDILGSEDKAEHDKEMARRKKAKEAGLPFRKKVLHVYGWCDSLEKLGFKTIMADEVQYIAEPETIRARAVSQICGHLGKSKKIFMSGTPYETKTAQFFTALHILDSEDFPNRYKYLMRYCNPVHTFFGWKFEGLSNADELHTLVSKIMIRRLKKDVLTQLPPKMRSVVAMTVTPSERSGYDMIDEQFEDDIRNGRKTRREQLGHISHLKQGAFEAKKRAVVQWIKDYLEVNDKLVVFIYHHDSYEYLMAEFAKIAVGITGETPADKRQGIVDKFQSDGKVRLFIGQIKASGVGLTLTKANATAFVEFGTTAPQHEQAEDRVHRIGQTADCVMAYYLILDNSIENDIMATLERRNKDLKKVLNNEDGASMFSTDEDMGRAVLAEYKKRKNIKELKNGKQVKD